MIVRSARFGACRCAGFCRQVQSGAAWWRVSPVAVHAIVLCLRKCRQESSAAVAPNALAMAGTCWLVALPEGE